MVLAALLARELPIEALAGQQHWSGRHWGARLAESAQHCSLLACLVRFGEAAGAP